MGNKYILLLIILTFSLPSLAQVEEEQETHSILSLDGPVTIELEGEDEEEDEEYEVPKKKRKKNVFYGLKTRKRFTKTGYGARQTLELFHILKDFQLPETLVRDIYWYDYKNNKIQIGGNINEKNAGILHGPYKKVRNNQVIEEGIFYMGLKHGRWTRYDENFILLDKSKYYKGWPKESLVKYYDIDQKQMKEIIPVEYGEKEGNYFYFHPNGKVAVKGEFKWGEKVGDWFEYYPSGKRKKIIRYGKEPYDDTFQPYILREWNAQGKVVYENRSR